MHASAQTPQRNIYWASGSLARSLARSHWLTRNATQEMEYAQKESLLGEINELEENAVNGVIEIIKVAESIVDDAEIDLGELQSSTMWKVRCWLPFTRPAMRMHACCLLA